MLRETELVVGDDGWEFEGYYDYTYDLNGNMTDKIIGGEYDWFDDYEYSYDAFNRLEKVYHTLEWEQWNDEIADVDVFKEDYIYDYSYNGNNELSKITTTFEDEIINTQDFYWDRSYIVKDNSSTYYLGVDGVFAQSSGTNMSYLLKNAHGDTVKVLRNGAVVGSEDYDPYGKDTDRNNYSSYKYANYYYDSYSGFYYLRNRFYDPSIGRFISEDSYWTVDNMIYGDEKSNDDSSTHINILDLITNSDKENKSSVEIRIPDNDSIVQSNNLYAYGMNNPIKYVDPFGQSLTISLGTIYAITATFAVAVTYFAAEHTKLSGSKKRTNDKHTKPRPGRATEKKKQNKNWKSRK